MDGLAWLLLRCEEVRGGGMGAPAVVTAVAIWGEGWGDWVTGWARGVFKVEDGAGWGEWWAWGVIGAVSPLREGLLESGEAGCCCCCCWP